MIKLNNKKYIALLICSIIVVIVATLSVTFAYLSFNSTQEGTNEINTGCFNIAFQDGASINSIGYPMNDDLGLSSTPYTFNLTNTCNTNAYFAVILNIKNTTNSNILPYIYYSFDDTNVFMLSDASKMTLPSNLIDSSVIDSYVINFGTLSGLQNKSFNLKMWIGNEAGYSIMNNKFVAEVMIYSMPNDELNFNTVTLKNLLPDGSFEDKSKSSLSGATFDYNEYLYGNASVKLAAGGTRMINQTIATSPIVGHVYYGRHSIKTNGNATPADCRFEWFNGDGLGKNFVFGLNNGNHSTWYTQSAVLTVTAVSGTGHMLRSFTVNSNVDVWTDGLMIIDLTEAFGSGNEPSKEWCDANIPYFSGSKSIVINGD